MHKSCEAAGASTWHSHVSGGQCDIQAVRLLEQAIVQILQPLAGPKVGEAVRKTVNEMFGVFAQSMAAAFQKFMRPDGTFPPRLGEQIVSHPCWPHSAEIRDPTLN